MKKALSFIEECTAISALLVGFGQMIAALEKLGISALIAIGLGLLAGCIGAFLSRKVSPKTRRAVAYIVLAGAIAILFAALTQGVFVWSVGFVGLFLVFTVLYCFSSRIFPYFLEPAQQVAQRDVPASGRSAR